MNELELFIRFSFLGLSLAVSIISLLSFVKTRELKIAFASIAFLVFTVVGCLVSVGVFVSSVEQLITTEILLGLIFISLIFFYLSIVKR